MAEVETKSKTKSEEVLISTLKSAFQGTKSQRNKLKMREMFVGDSNCRRFSKRPRDQKIGPLMNQKVC